MSRQLRHPIYLDNCATTPLDPIVAAHIAQLSATVYGNPSSQHTEGRRAGLLLQNARAIVAKRLEAVPAEIIFTASGTEANNLAFHSAIQQSDPAQPCHIIATNVEHPSVYKRLEWEVSHGAGRVEVDWLPVDNGGAVRWDLLESLVKPHTRLISVIHGNNETGILQSLDAIKEVKLRNPRCLLHIDAVQTFSKIDLNTRLLPIDFASISAHKIHGPKGAGALFARAGVAIDPLLVGGAQEKYRRAGTENIAAICGFAKAIETAPPAEDYHRSMQELESIFLEEISKVSFNINTGNSSKLPGFLNLAFPDYPSKEDLQIALDIEGVYLSSTSACHSGVVEDSHVLRAMGVAPNFRDRSIRMQFNRFHTTDDAREAGRRLAKILQRA